MDDTISRQAAIDLCDWYDNPSMRDDLIKLPSAQKRGKWLWIKVIDYHVCSNCFAVMQYNPEKGHLIINTFNTLPNFCYQCGADMRGEAHD